MNLEATDDRKHLLGLVRKLEGGEVKAENFGKNLKEICDNLGLNQTELARRTRAYGIGDLAGDQRQTRSDSENNTQDHGSGAHNDREANAMNLDLSRAKEIASRKAINPIGKCFDSAAFQMVFGENPPRTFLVHGTGIATAPWCRGQPMIHAWLEFDDHAIDTTYGVITNRHQYRKDLKISHSVRYGRDEARRLWIQEDHPGPWDPVIISFFEQSKRNRGGDGRSNRKTQENRRA
jgi:hypothetical protein